MSARSPADPFRRMRRLRPASIPAPRGRALDRLVAAYALLAGVALAFPHRPGAWPILAGLHLLLIAAVLRPEPVHRVMQPIAGPLPGAAGFVRGSYPLLLIPLLYSELAVLNRAVHGGRYFDDLVMGWEVALFGGQPSQALAEAAPWLPLSEALHAAYLSYYLIIYVPPLLLFLAGRHRDFERMVFVLVLTFFVHYLFFIYFPVQGPRYLFPPAGAGEGPFLQLTHAILERGSSQGAAFPSSHVAIAVVQTALVARLLPRLFPVLAIVTAGLTLGTVYGGFHYAVDALAGLVLGLALVGVGGFIQRALLRRQRRPRPAMGAVRVRRR